MNTKLDPSGRDVAFAFTFHPNMNERQDVTRSIIAGFSGPDGGSTGQWTDHRSRLQYHKCKDGKSNNTVCGISFVVRLVFFK